MTIVKRPVTPPSATTSQIQKKPLALGSGKRKLNKEGTVKSVSEIAVVKRQQLTTKKTPLPPGRKRVTPALRVERIEVKDNFLAAIKRVNKISRLDRVSATQLKTVFRQLGLDQSDSMINKTFKAKDGCPTGKQISHMVRGIEDDTLLKWEAKRVAIPPHAPSPAVSDEIAIIQPEDTGRKSLTEMLRSQPEADSAA